MNTFDNNGYKSSGTSYLNLNYNPKTQGVKLTVNSATVFSENSAAMNGFSAIAILAIVGTALAVFLFNGIIRVSSALFASGVTYFIPIVAVIIGFYYGETISNWQILAMFIVLIGVVLANYGAKLFSRSKKT